jgi:hypothetical protein
MYVKLAIKARLSSDVVTGYWESPGSINMTQRAAVFLCSMYISYLVLLGVEIHPVSVELRLLTSLLFIIWMIGDLTGSNDSMLLVAEAPTTEKEIYLLPVCLPPI